MLLKLYINFAMVQKPYNNIWPFTCFVNTENHRTQTKFDDALIFKLFAFQFVNSYASCYYIAFFRGVSKRLLF